MLQGFNGIKHVKHLTQSLAYGRYLLKDQFIVCVHDRGTVKIQSIAFRIRQILPLSLTKDSTGPSVFIFLKSGNGTKILIPIPSGVFG